MVSETLRPGITQGAYPERIHEVKNAVDATVHNVIGMFRRRTLNPVRQGRQFVTKVNEYSSGLEKLSDRRFKQRVLEIRQQLTCDGLSDDHAAKAFSLVREAASRTLGQRHYDTQILGGWVLLKGMLAEMETGEGKTLTATLTACTAALAGIPVHAITANDYLAQRDAQLMAPIYKMMGLTVSAVTGKEYDADKRRSAYACDVIYCTAKQITFDYLRDRVSMGSRRGRLELQLRDLSSNDAKASSPLLLRGLCFAVIDEADSILIDEASTPLILSQELDGAVSKDTYLKALEIAGDLDANGDYFINQQYHDVQLSNQGRAHLFEQIANAGESCSTKPWTLKREAESLVKQALRALLCYRKDHDYLVRDGKIEIIDPNTGRAMPDHSWEQGLHQMIEVREGCELTGERETIARISYQRFFRRYLHLSGMTGTAKEVASELWPVYGLEVVKIPTYRPVLRKAAQDHLYANSGEKWQAIAKRVQEISNKGRPVLVGTSSVKDSEQLSALLSNKSIPHQVLNARQDEREAEIVASAGKSGVVTVATNMAGRGTDISLAHGVAEKGGLHVISADRNEARRIDRQLFGRCGRQGDPGSFDSIFSLDDPLLKKHFPATLTSLISLLTRWGVPVPGRSMMWIAQRMAERHQAKARNNLLKVDDKLKDNMAFSGPIE